MNYLSSSQLKALSREQLLGKYKTVTLATLLVAVISMCIYIVSTAFANETTLTGYIFYTLINFMVDIVTGIFIVGLIVLNLNIVCGKPYAVSDIYYGFRSHTNKLIQLRFILCAMEFIVSLPYTICLYLNSENFSYITFSLGMLLFIPAVILIVLIELNLGMSYYLMVDFPDYSVKDLLLLSIHIMKGHKGRLFYLMASFIPLLLLGILSFGLGFIWIIPYFRMSQTNFYLDIVKVKNQQQ